MLRGVRVISVGADPGESAAIAVGRGARGKRPVLLGLWQIHGSTDAAWFRRADVAVGGLWDVLDAEAGIERPVVSLEGAVPVARGPFAHHASGWGLGFRAGVLFAMLREQLGVMPCVVLPSKAGWWGPLTMGGKPLGPKRDGGQHRIGEAGLFCDGAAAALAGLDMGSDAAKSRRVDAAEAVLIACARAYRELGIKAERPAKAKRPRAKPATTNQRKARGAA